MADANVLVAGAIWPRFPFEVLRHAENNDYRLALTGRIIAEALQATERIAPRQLTDLEAILLASSYELVPDPSRQLIKANSTLVRDEKDVHVALAAINAGVDYLITQDRNFTDRDETTEALHQRLNVILPGTFLREHMDWSGEALEAIRHRDWEDFQD